MPRRFFCPQLGPSWSKIRGHEARKGEGSHGRAAHSTGGAGAFSPAGGIARRVQAVGAAPLERVCSVLRPGPPDNFRDRPLRLLETGWEVRMGTSLRGGLRPNARLRE